MFVTNVVEIYENPWSKNFINKSCHKYPKIIEIKNNKFLFSKFFAVTQKGFIFFRN